MSTQTATATPPVLVVIDNPLDARDPMALDFHRNLALGMTVQQAAELVDIENLPYDEWLQLYGLDLEAEHVGSVRTW